MSARKKAKPKARPPATPPGPPPPLRVFISRCKKDTVYLDQLLPHLSLLEGQGKIKVWYDKDIHPRTKWEPQIQAELEQAHVILMLLTVHFIESDYCFRIEMPEALKRFEDKKAIATWVYVLPCEWRETPLSAIQGQPVHGECLPEGVRASHQYWCDVAKAIREMADHFQKHGKPI